MVEDSAHVYDTTLAALEGFNRLVPVDGFFVVEDGCVDVEPLRLTPDRPRGVPSGGSRRRTGNGSPRSGISSFYGVSCHPGGSPAGPMKPRR